MGFHSYRCAKSGHPILAKSKPWPKDIADLTEVVLVLPGDTKVFGTYTGFGRIDVDRIEGNAEFGELAAGRLIELKDIKLVLQRHYAGERYDDLQVSQSDPKQGHFWSFSDVRDTVSGRRHYGGRSAQREQEPVEWDIVWTADSFVKVQKEYGVPDNAFSTSLEQHNCVERIQAAIDKATESAQARGVDPSVDGDVLFLLAVRDDAEDRTVQRPFTSMGIRVGSGDRVRLAMTDDMTIDLVAAPSKEFMDKKTVVMSCDEGPLAGGKWNFFMPTAKVERKRLLKDPVTVPAEHGTAIVLWGDTTIVAQTDGSRLTIDAYQGTMWRRDISVNVVIPELAPSPAGP